MSDSRAFGTGALLADVVATLVVVGIAFELVLRLNPGAVRTLVAVCLLLVLPGYALTTVLFPGRSDARPRSGDLSSIFDRRNVSGSGGGLHNRERAVLGFGLSIALVPLFAFLLDVTGVPFDAPFVAAITEGFTAIALLLGAVRRFRTSPETRYVLPWSRLRAFGSWIGAGDRVNQTLNVFLVLTVVVATASVGFSLVATPEAEQYTQASILTEQDGELVTGGYPDQMTVGQPNELVFSIDNKERERQRYSVVVELQRVDETGDVVRSAEVTRFSNTVAATETWTRPHEVAPPFAGENLRLTYLVYRGDPPSNPDIGSSYRHLTVWTTVTERGN
jgi:uncharacterized membrane protein